MWQNRSDAWWSHVDSIWGEINESPALSVVRKTSGMAFIAPNCLPRRSAGVYQCGGNGFFWNPSLTELTERSFSDERRVKNASHRAAMPEPLIDNPWRRLPRRRWETVAFPLLIQKIRPDNFGDLFTLLGCLLEVGCFFFFSPRFKWLFISSLHLLFLCSRYQFILTEDSLGKHNAEKYNYFTVINATITTVQIFFF